MVFHLDKSGDWIDISTLSKHIDKPENLITLYVLYDSTGMHAGFSKGESIWVYKLNDEEKLVSPVDARAEE